MADTPFLGCKISLISKCDIRYEGILYCVDPKESTIALSKVRSFGTEGRGDPNNYVPPKSDVFDIIIFRASDVKDLRVDAPEPPGFSDPAIISARQSSTTFDGTNNGSLPTSTGPTQQHQPPQQQQSQQQKPLLPFLPNNTKDQQSQVQHHQQHSQQQQKQAANYSSVVSNAQRRSRPENNKRSDHESNNRKSESSAGRDGHRRANERDDRRSDKRDDRRGNNDRRVNNDRRDRDRDNDNRRNDGGRPFRANRGGQDNRNYANSNQRYNYRRGQNFRDENSKGGSYRRGSAQGGRRGRSNDRTGAPRGPRKGVPLKFDSEYDFDEANKIFLELEGKLKSMNLKGDEKDGDTADRIDSKSPTGQSESGSGYDSDDQKAGDSKNGRSESVGEEFYDKSKSFFDNISCEASERSQGKVNKPDWRKERQMNAETFGVSANYRRGGYFRGRSFGANGYRR